MTDDEIVYAIAGCRPVVWSERFQVVDMPPTPIYPGSTIRLCPNCHTEIYVGPKAQEAGLIAMCFICAALTAVALNDGDPTLNIGNLGNTWKPKQ